MTNEQLEQQSFERGFHNVPEPYQFAKMPGDVLRLREAESVTGSMRQLAFAEEIARRERWIARLWQVFLVVLGLVGQALLMYFHLRRG
jgi:hypothetical protein